MNDDTLGDTLLTDMFVSDIVCQELHQINYVISGDGLYSQCVRVCVYVCVYVCVCVCVRARARERVKFHFWQTQCIL